MYWYSFTYLINAIGIYSNGKLKKYFKYMVLALLIFICGTRYYMGGSDVLAYEGVYNSVPNVKNVILYFFTGTAEGINENYEIGFLFFCSVVKALGFSYFGFILIWTIIFYLLMVKGLEEFVPNWNVFFAFFMYKIMFYNTFISIRQGLTMAIFCYSLKYIRDRKWYIYFPLCYLAFLEHKGAVIMFPLYFITYLPTSKNFIKYYSLLWLPTLFLSANIDLSNLLSNVAEFVSYDKGVEGWIESTEKISIIHTIECYLIVAAVLIFYDKIMSTKNRKEITLALQIMLMSVPIFTLFKDWIVLTREKDYFVLMYGIVFGYILDGGTLDIINDNEFDLTTNRRTYLGVTNWKLVAFIAIAACFIGMIRYVLVFDGGHLMDYQSFVFRGVSIFN